MKTAKTQYGTLTGIIYEEYYKNGMLKDCVLEEKNIIDTPAGLMIPKYKEDSVRKKRGLSLSFYESGKISRLALDTQTYIGSPAGRMPAELVTFYESGSLRRVFPLNGQLSGFWTEQNEYGFAEPLMFYFPFGSILAKVICVHFYDCGPVKSLTFWPQESPVVEAPCGKTRIRIGISLYKNGSVKSIEPFKPTGVKTPIGIVPAFDINAIGICGDSNSLVFAPDGTIEALKTTACKITAKTADENMYIFSPKLVMSHFRDDVMAVKPLSIEFKDGSVFFDGTRIKKVGTVFDVKEFNYAVGGDACQICGN